MQGRSAVCFGGVTSRPRAPAGPLGRWHVAQAQHVQSMLPARTALVPGALCWGRLGWGLGWLFQLHEEVLNVVVEAAGAR